jgi:hypothetical protein
MPTYGVAMRHPHRRQSTSSLASLRISLLRPDVALLKRIERAIDLERLVGPESCFTLRSGYKVEIEGAMNPAFYRPSHGHWIFRHFGSLARARAAARPIRGSSGRATIEAGTP